jgi:hypothetical protein
MSLILRSFLTWSKRNRLAQLLLTLQAIWSVLDGAPALSQEDPPTGEGGGAGP